MTTYHVWLVDQVEPETIQADGVIEGREDGLVFLDHNLDGPAIVRRSLKPAEWRQWAVVHDEADTVHL